MGSVSETTVSVIKSHLIRNANNITNEMKIIMDFCSTFPIRLASFQLRKQGLQQILQDYQILLDRFSLEIESIETKLKQAEFDSKKLHP